MVSATQLSSYSYCPRKLFINYVLLVREEPKEALVKGTIRHNTYDFINKDDERIVKSIKTKNYNDIYDIYRLEYSKFLRNSIIKNKTELKKFNIQMTEIFKEVWPYFDEEAKTRALNLTDFISKHNIFGEELWKKLTPKILSEQYFSSKELDLSGIIDVIEVYESNENDTTSEKIYLPIELKTGKAPLKGMWDGHRLQLGAYILLLQDAGKKSEEGCLRYLDINDKRIIMMNSFFKEELLTLIKKINQTLIDFNPPEIIENKNKCAKCSLKDICYNQQEMNKFIEEAKHREK